MKVPIVLEAISRAEVLMSADSIEAAKTKALDDAWGHIENPKIFVVDEIRITHVGKPLTFSRSGEAPQLVE